MIFNSSPKRLVIFLFYDNEGIVDSYIPYMLSDMKKNAERIVLVANGDVNAEGKEKLNGIVDDIFERENVGFDVWGYKTALERIGWDEIRKYDELVMMNYTIMGPVYPFKEMFDVMDKRDVDFWGITKYHHVPVDPFGTTECGYIHEHIQSHFIAVRGDLLRSDDLKNYWNNMPMIKSYSHSVGRHEIHFTYTFQKLGYKWEVYVNTDEYEGITEYPVFFYPMQLIRDKRCPIFKRRNFFHNYSEFLVNTTGEPTFELMNYLKNHTDYDTDMIFENLLRCYNMADIKDVLHLNFIMPKSQTKETAENKIWEKSKIALIFHAYFPDLIDSAAQYINNMPSNADVYITTDTPEKKALFEERFKNNKFNKLEVILIENRGRDVSALLVASKGFIMDYDYVCFAHDKKITQLKPCSIGASFIYHCLENVLGSEDYVKNIIDTLHANKRMGLLTPMPPMHSAYNLILGSEWGPNYDVTRRLADRLRLKVDISKDKQPIAPHGTMFWFKPKSMKKLFDENWEYMDFPKEPNKTDRTLLHAIERIYSYVAQDAGYYTGWCFNKEYAELTVTNLSHYYRNINVALISAELDGSHYDIIHNIEKTGKVRKALTEAADQIADVLNDYSTESNGIKSFRLYYDDGTGFSEEKTIPENFTNVNGKRFSSFNIPKTCGIINQLRLDPGETGGVVLSGLSYEIQLENDKVLRSAIKYSATNGLTDGKKFVMTDADPWISWNVNCNEKIKNITVIANVRFDVSSKDITEIIKHGIKRKQKNPLIKRVLRKLKSKLKK